MSLRRASLQARRARPPAAAWLVGFLIVLHAAPAAAQVTPGEPSPGDTLVTVPIPPEEVSGDTIPEALREAATSVARTDVIPEMTPPLPAGWAYGRWEWTREELATLPGMTLLEFIQHVPGVTRFRAGGFGRPEGITALGAGGGRVRVFLDGLELDPHAMGTFPLETIALLDIERLRVQRTVAGIRVDVDTFRLTTPEPYSVVELGTGVYQTRVLRALFSRGFGDRSVGTGAFDIANTAGIGLREEYSHSNVAFRFDHALSDETGVRVEWRRTAQDRRGTVFPAQLSRSDLVARVRRSLGERLTLEASAARSSSEDEAVPDSAVAYRSTQLGVRGVYSSERVGGEASVRGRLRGGELTALPTLDAEARASLVPFAGARVEGGIRTASGDGATALESELTASVSPFRGAVVFGSLAFGERLVRDLAVRPAGEGGGGGEGEIGTDRLLAATSGGWRAGAEVGVGAGVVGVAGFSSAVSPVSPFGLAFDRGAQPVSDEGVLGGEAYFRLPVPRTGNALHLEGWYTRTTDAERPYLPADQGVVALTFGRTYYEGQLQPSLRVEGVHRGRTIVAGGAGGAFDVVAPGYRTANLALTIRIIDVQAFLLWENLPYVQTALDLPGPVPAAPRIVYGASWRFSN